MKFNTYQAVLLLSLSAIQTTNCQDIKAPNLRANRKLQGGGGRPGQGAGGGGNGGGNGGGQFPPPPPPQGGGGGGGGSNGGGNGSGFPAPNPADPTTGDLGIRFSKVTFANPDDEPSDFLPLDIDKFPMRVADFNVLKNSNAVSVVTQADYEVKYDLDQLISSLGGLPTYPNSDPADPYWDELEEVIDYQIIRRADPNAAASTLLESPPALWTGFTLDDASEAVHDEYPGYWQGKLIENIASQGINIDYDIIPPRSKAEFLHGIVMLADLNTWSIGTVGPNSFGAKWYAGRPRPEEIAFKIATGELGLDQGVPQRIIDKIESMQLQTAEEFTAYPEGSPRHPSWPAMHSAASQASFWLAVVLDLTPAQLIEAKRVDHAVAMARTIAGVHYRTDNMFGLNLGIEVIADMLPDYLSERYGSNKDAVRAKINALKWSWPTDLN